MSEHQEKFSRKAEAELRRAAQHAEKDEEAAREKADGYAKKAYQGAQSVAASVSAGVAGALQGARSVAAAAAARAHSLGSQSWEQLHNPVVLLNALFGVGAVGGMLCGYAQYNTRYLKGKSDGAVLAIVGGASALLAADAVLSAKYYRRYRK